MATVTARCACGTHNIKLPGPPPRVTLCFCADCQLRSGGPFGIGTFYSTERLDLPEIPKRRRTADSGRWIDDHHCSQCGVVLFYTTEWKPGVVGIPLGLVRGFESVPPDRAVFCRSKPDWVVLPSGIDAYVCGSDGPRAQI